MKKLMVIPLMFILVLAAWWMSPVRAQPPAMGPGFYEETFFLLNYVAGGGGGWGAPSTSSVCAGAGNDSRRHTDAAGAYVEFYIWGDGFTAYVLSGTIQPTHDALFCINGSCSSVNLYTPSAVVLLDISFTGLGYGTHHIQIVKPAPSSSDYRLSLCSILVHPPAPQPTLEPQEIIIEVTWVPEQPEHRQQFTITDLSNEEHNVAFDFVLTPGDLLTGSLLFVLVALGMQTLFMKFGSGGGLDE